MSRIADGREQIAGLLELVLPGRSSPYPPGLSFSAPYLWVDQPTGRTETGGQRSTFIVATFPVWVAVDGEDRAQLAQLDEYVAAVWDACEATAGVSPRSWAPRELPDKPRVRAVVIDVAVTVTARTLSSPNTAAAQTPPVPLEVN